MNLFIFLYAQSSAQQALMGTINTSMQAVQKAQIDLGEVDNLPPLGQDMVLYSAHKIHLPIVNINPLHIHFLCTL